MPAILVASKMKSGLPKPKPVHSALPIPQTPARPAALSLSLPPAPLKTHVPSPGQQQVGPGPPGRKASGSEAGANTQAARGKEGEPASKCTLGSLSPQRAGLGATGGVRQAWWAIA
ncbi:putative neuron navigator 2-like [Scophthalmus maximus]|uniref:Putative neuron navigator 2-like n=1 Tax=Scophthalmus maximus TaxID=52904 RepID=A0A2U9BB46_SCOMX|nr:putative neuron navigator 2-like [Scophthalmus maximus]